MSAVHQHQTPTVAVALDGSVVCSYGCRVDAGHTRREGSWRLAIFNAGAILILTAAAAVMFIGLLSGLVIVAAHWNLQRVRRSGSRRELIGAFSGVVIAWLGAAVAYWFWQDLLWGQHHHPGGGGPIPPPTFGDLAAMPLVSATLGLVAVLCLTVTRRFRATRCGVRRGPSAGHPATPDQ
jgi:hypothetical protein